jgi:hypothetical protein
MDLYDAIAAFEPVSRDETLDDVTDQMSCRDAMVDVHRLSKEQLELKTTLAEITERYKNRVRDLEEKEDQLRENIARWLEISERTTIDFPDVGKATLRRTPDKVLIADMEVVKSSYGDRFTKPAFDEPAFKAWAKERWLMDGELVNGIRALPEGRQVALSFK